MFGGERKGKKEKKRKKRKEMGKREKKEVIFPGFWVLSMGREQKRESGVRSSTFSLRFTEIGSSEQEAKFIYATRASYRYKNMRFSPNSKR